MINPYVAAILLAVFMPPSTAVAQTPIFKCAANGAITYQNAPCPASGPRTAPTVEQLNAERRQKLRENADSRSKPASAAPTGQFSSRPGESSGSQTPVDRARARSLTAPAAMDAGAYRCDGRIHCSQMTSCSEAKYFLSHCPGVKMDGDRDGIPCEDQWCG